jgi:hypothetical protein
MEVITAILLSLAALEPGRLEPIRIAADARGFVLVPSGRPFTPWGLNYGNAGRLVEDYWEAEWPTIVKDFRDMKSLGANVVRCHLQFGKFMDSADRPNPKALDRLGRLLRLAEETGVYLDPTGLGCYRKADVPAWYDGLTEETRWAAQARFWGAVAACCAASPAVFCYDLMNEPVVPGSKRNPGDWYSGKSSATTISSSLSRSTRPPGRAMRLPGAGSIGSRLRFGLTTASTRSRSGFSPGYRSGVISRGSCRKRSLPSWTS